VLSTRGFDGRACQLLGDVQERQGITQFDSYFGMLHEWLGKKASRDGVQKWPVYIMKLLTHWSATA